MVDNIVVMVNGQISEAGSYEELLSHDRAFAHYLRTRTHQQQEDSDDDEDEECMFTITYLPGVYGLSRQDLKIFYRG